MIIIISIITSIISIGIFFVALLHCFYLYPRVFLLSIFPPHPAGGGKG